MTNSAIATDEQAVLNIRLIGYKATITIKELDQTGTEACENIKNAFLLGIMNSQGLRSESTLGNPAAVAFLLQTIANSSIEWVAPYHGVINIVVTPQQSPVNTAVVNVSIADKGESGDGRLLHSSFFSIDLYLTLVKREAVVAETYVSAVITFFNP
jgi:hypothetical protein